MSHKTKCRFYKKDDGLPDFAYRRHAHEAYCEAEGHECLCGDMDREQKAWVEFGAAALEGNWANPEGATLTLAEGYAQAADDMLEEWRKRFGDEELR